VAWTVPAVHVVPLVLTLFDLVPRNTPLDRDELARLELPNGHPRVGEEVKRTHVVRFVTLVRRELARDLELTPARVHDLGIPHEVLAPVGAEDTKAILCGVVNPDIVWREHLLDLVVDERFKRLRLLLGLAVPSGELMYRAAGEEYTRPIRVRGHKHGVRVRKLNRGVRRLSGVPTRPSCRVSLALGKICEHTLLGFFPLLMPHSL